MDSKQKIRQAEAHSHTIMYIKQELFTAGSWLAKPVKTVVELFPLFSDYQEIRCLDLGCGVGRNSIPAARAFAKSRYHVDSVDILPLALQRLQNYAQQYGVSDVIRGIVSAIDDYEIEPEQYDLILAVSALEHVASTEILHKKLGQIQDGQRKNGVACFIINSGVTEKSRTTGAYLPPQFEVNLDTGDLRQLLELTFARWSVLKSGVSYQKYEIPRDGEIVEVESNVVTWVVQK